MKYWFFLIILLLSFTIFSEEKKTNPNEISKRTIVSFQKKMINQEILVWHGDHYSEEKNKLVKKKMGWIFPINSKVVHRQEYLGKILYEVSYHTNQFGLRKLPPLKNQRKKHLIIAGDSNTFGWGVTDEETVPYLLSQKLPDYHGYNFGVGASGPNNTLAFFKFLPWGEGIEENEGKMIYIFYPNWMTMRVIGSKNFYKWASAEVPWFDLDSDANLIYKGNYDSRLLTYFFKIINFIDYFQWIGELPKTNLRDMMLVSKIFLEMKKEYLKKFPMGEFIVALSSSVGKKEDLIPDLLKLLQKENIRVVEIHKNNSDNHKYHHDDYHFNAKGQQLVVDELLNTVRF